MPEFLLPEFLLPPSLSPGIAALLVAASFFTSALTASMGIGGGVLMLTIMAYVLPVAALIPVHGAVQLGSNAGRFAMLRRHVAWRPLAAFAAGSVVGALLGARFVTALPETVLTLVLATFILAVTWVPLPRLDRLGPQGFAATGAATTFLSMFVGATGLINAALLGRIFESRLVLVGTFAGIMTAQNAFKSVGFALAGFDFAPWLALVAAMMATGLIGTILGGRLLARTPEARFRLGFRILLSLMAADLIRRVLF